MNEYVAIVQMVVTAAAATAILIQCRRWTVQMSALARSVNDLRIVMTDLAHATVVLTRTLQHTQQSFEGIGRCLDRLERNQRMLPAEIEVDAPLRVEHERVRSTSEGSG